MRGMKTELHLSKNRLGRGRCPLVCTFLHIDDSVEELNLLSGVPGGGGGRGRADALRAWL